MYYGYMRICRLEEGLIGIKLYIWKGRSVGSKVVGRGGTGRCVTARRYPRSKATSNGLKQALLASKKARKGLDTFGVEES